MLYSVQVLPLHTIGFKARSRTNETTRAMLHNRSKKQRCLRPMECKCKSLQSSERNGAVVVDCPIKRPIITSGCSRLCLWNGLQWLKLQQIGVTGKCCLQAGLPTLLPGWLISSSKSPVKASTLERRRELVAARRLATAAAAAAAEEGVIAALSQTEGALHILCR